ncbi:SDR family NAD(P)-dependent oxidoreductase [Streptomyces sp. NPDC057580]|uniref:SDR family NAD(P)-dependent oxidoreductase n=1 Tax=Streptomyces sp. NPDC057580 TaxID=3346173 RepID=UPI00368662A0
MTSTRRLLITGAASGIGAAVRESALADGLSVAALDRVTPGATERPTHDAHSVAVTADVLDPAAVGAAFNLAEQRLDGPLTELVHCAGVYEPGTATAALPLETWTRTLAVNATGTFVVVQEFARRLIEAGLGGSAVLLSSMASQRGNQAAPGNDYGASKGAVEALARGLAQEWGPSGIRVNVVRPGVIDTPMLRMTDDPEQAARYLEQSVPLRRFGRASEVADACLYLVSNRASYITGAVLDVDGGVLTG